MKIRSYRDLKVWQRSMDLVVECYRLAKAFPREEQFALNAQLRRAVVSIPSNISEGHGRATTNSYINHLSIATGSLAEVETLLEIAVRLRYVASVDMQRANQLAVETSRMLSALIARLRKRRRNQDEE
jgi:four helix bundle protein